MNIKIYFNNKFLLLSDESLQPTANQIIVNSENGSLKDNLNLIQEFIQQNEGANLIFSCKSVNSFFSEIKHLFLCIEAAGGIISQNNHYLFIYRLKKWDLPKGKIEKKESIEAAAIRECEEECGINGLRIISSLPTTYHIYKHNNQLVLKTTYWFKMQSNFQGQLIPQLAESIEKAEWLDVTAINKMVLENTYPSVTDLILSSIINKK